MRFAKFSSIFDYITSLLKQINELQQQSINTIYRITDVKQSSADSVKIVIQLIGKSTFIECTPQEIAGDDRFLEGFSKKDIRTITYYACLPRNKPKYKLIAQEFCDDKLAFKLKKLDSNEIIFKNAGDLLLDKNIIDHLNLEDMRSISYAAGYEHSQH